MEDSKYVVFKRQDWDRFRSRQDVWPPDYLRPVEDAVVIRRQDTFAPPALDAYGNAILCAIEILKLDASEPKTFETLERLQDIADYFHTQASKAWAEDRKLPD